MPRYRLPRRQVLASLGAAPVASIFPPGVHAGVAPRDAAAGPAVDSQWLLDGMVLPGNLEWSVDEERGTLRWAAHYDLESQTMRVHVADRATLQVPAVNYWSAPFSTTPDLDPISGPAALRNALHLGRMDASELGAGRLRMNLHRVL